MFGAIAPTTFVLLGLWFVGNTLVLSTNPQARARAAAAPYCRKLTLVVPLTIRYTRGPSPFSDTERLDIELAQTRKLLVEGVPARCGDPDAGHSRDAHGLSRPFP